MLQTVNTAITVNVQVIKTVIWVAAQSLFQKPSQFIFVFTFRTEGFHLYF